jgi:ankyrin repeat protein
MQPITPEEEARYEELLHMAMDFARNGQTDTLIPMIEAGLSVNLSDAKGNTLLMLSAYNNQLQCAHALLQRGARVDQKNDRGQTPLAGVCFKGYKEMAELLVRYGANIYENNGLGATPLTFALLFGHKELAQTLIQKSSQKPSLFSRIFLKILSFKKSKKPSEKLAYM